MSMMFERPEMTAFLVKLRARDEGRLPVTTGKRLHGAVMELIREHDPDLAEKWHSQGLKPYTLSPLKLQGDLQPPVERNGNNRYAIVPAGSSWQFRVTTLTRDVGQRLMGCFKQSRLMRLDDSAFELDGFIVHNNPLVGGDIYHKLILDVQRIHIPNRPKITFKFRSPTAFRSNGVTILYPDPGKVFESLVRRWNAFASEISKTFEVPDARKDMLINSWQVSAYNLKTLNLDFQSPEIKNFKAFTGLVTFQGVKDASKDALKDGLLLGRFAFYAGIGYGCSSKGMGQTRWYRNF